MRKELRLIEIIEKYISGEMTAEEKKAFEIRLERHPQLHQQLMEQKELMAGLERHAIRSEVQKVFKSYQWRQRINYLGAPLFVGLLILSSMFFYFYSNIEEEARNGVDSYFMSVSTDDKEFDYQMVFDADSSALFESPEGVLIIVPEHAFLDASGKIVEGEVELKYAEAITPESILEKGLSTVSKDGLLETGGMFNLEAFQNNKPLKFNPDRGIYIEIPTNNTEKGMQLYEGQKDSIGQIVWTKPKAIKNLLVPVDITTLDFYPPDFLDTVAALGFNIEDKTLTDSLYYSLATIPLDRGEKLFKSNCTSCHKVDRRLVGPALEGSRMRWQGREEDLVSFIKNSQRYLKEHPNDEYAHNLYDEYNKSIMTPTALSRRNIKLILDYVEGKSSQWKPLELSNDIGDVLQDDLAPKEEAMDTTAADYEYTRSIRLIHPLSVKAFWNKKFTNSYLSTREFEKRMPFIHKSCNELILKAYLENMDKPLYIADSIAETITRGNLNDVFGIFYQNKAGKVEGSELYAKSLMRYYSKKKKALQLALKATIKKSQQQKAKEIEEEEKVIQKQNRLNSERIAKNREMEFKQNLTKVCRELGIKHRFTNRITSFRVVVNTPGWKNIDRPVLESTISRTSKTFELNGKKSSLTYEALNVTVESSFDSRRVQAYLLPKNLYSFQRLKRTNSSFSERLNLDFSYNLMVTSVQEDSVYLFEKNDVKAGDLSIELSNAISKSDFKKRLREKYSRRLQNHFSQENEYISVLNSRNKRIEKEKELEKIKRSLAFGAFPCSYEYMELDLSEEF